MSYIINVDEQNHITRFASEYSYTPGKTLVLCSSCEYIHREFDAAPCVDCYRNKPAVSNRCYYQAKALTQETR